MFIGKRKDGGPESTVTGWFFELKSLFTIALLRFDGASREAFHSHAFHCWSVLLKGQLVERHYLTDHVDVHTAPAIIKTRRSTWHMVDSVGTSWVLTFRGPWMDRWVEFVPGKGFVKLTHGRVPANG